MSFVKNTKLIGQHAYLSPSTYHWLDYDEDKLRRVFFEKQLARRGDELHTYAQRAIDLKILQADNGTTLSMYINDAIGFRMEAEVPLYYSDDCFGTCDAIGFRDMTLRIHDLKTGVKPASMKQLLIYAAIFFFEYALSPKDVKVILRIYQNDAIEEFLPDLTDIVSVMSRVKTQAALIAYLREED
jgi:uncharacterized protein DUF2800